MLNTPARVVIHTHDIMRMSAISKRAAQRLLVQIRKHFNRTPRSLVSVEDYCEFTGFKEDKVNQFLK